jgi:hypothetical protein
VGGDNSKEALGFFLCVLASCVKMKIKKCRAVKRLQRHEIQVYSSIEERGALFVRGVRV